MSDRERIARVSPVEFRAAPKGSDNLGTLTGFAAVYDKFSVDLGGFTERIAPGAFNKTVADGRDVIAKFNHDPNMMLGRTSSGSVRLYLDDAGLRYEVDLPDTTVGRDVRALASRGDLTASSFEFRVRGDGDSWEQRDDGTVVRTLTEVQLYDVAPVVSPAYPDATVGLKRFAEARGLDFPDVQAAATAARLSELLVTRDEAPDDGAPDDLHAPDVAAAAHRVRLLALKMRGPVAG